MVPSSVRVFDPVMATRPWTGLVPAIYIVMATFTILTGVILYGSTLRPAAHEARRDPVLYANVNEEVQAELHAALSTTSCT